MENLTCNFSCDMKEQIEKALIDWLKCWEHLRCEKGQSEEPIMIQRELIGCKN